jgi:DNA-binding MarR family transcriptional regulator
MDEKEFAKYRPLIAQVVRFGNVVIRNSKRKQTFNSEIPLTPHEWQVLEYLYKNEHANQRMGSITDYLGFAQSTVSKCIKTLENYGLVERYQFSDNRKEVISRLSEAGREEFGRRVKLIDDSLITNAVRHLGKCRKKDLEAFRAFLDELSGAMDGREEKTLIALP